MSQHHEQQQVMSRLKNQTKALYQAQRRANPPVRSLEQSSNTGQRRIAREEPGVQEQRWEQEQPANTRQQALAREEPGVQEQRWEQEQPVDTMRRAVAREELGVVREQEQPVDTMRQAVAREELVVREQEQTVDTMRRAVAREEQGVQEQEQPVDTVRNIISNSHSDYAMNLLLLILVPMQDSKTVMWTAIQMPSFSALQVVFVSLISHKVKNIHSFHWITHLHL